MSNPISYALDRMMQSGIPKSILEVAFLSRFSNNYKGINSLKDRIREEVINPRVLVDCNLLHGAQITIPLVQCERLSQNYFETVYRIPPSLTNGKSVISVLEVTASSGSVVSNYGETAGNTGGMYTNSMMGVNNAGGVLSAQQQLLRSASPVQSVSNALVYLLGDNTVLIKDAVMVPSTMQIRVMVEHDSEFNHIQPGWYPDFHKLALLAVKAYIYNLIVIEQDNAFIASGGELNRFKDIVDGYSDAEEQYAEQLDVWYKCALLNDPESNRQHYQMHTGGLW